MSPECEARLKAMITRHEADKQFPYTDTVGKLTIGIGWNLTDRGLPQKIRDELYYIAHDEVLAALMRYWWFDQLDEVRQAALVDMVYNIGPGKFAEFHDTIHALANGDYAAASREMLDSKWAKQVGQRAVELADMVHHGVWPN